MSDFSGNSHSGTEAIAFGARALNSELFRELFREGMALVEETAAYLDGEGRAESRTLGRAATLAYSTESMRLTTRLMQIASWLLVQRAVREGDMPPESAREDRYRLGAEDICRGATTEDLPAGLLMLLDRSERLYERVRHLDRRMYIEDTEPEDANPVLSQVGRLQAAFGA